MDNNIVNYSKNQVRKAGASLRLENLAKDKEKQNLEIVNHWRDSISIPLELLYKDLLIFDTNDNSVLSKRLKRLPSIIKKLKRNNDSCLDTMQDIGGCRLIVQSVIDVYKLCDKFNAIQKPFTIKNTDDYIDQPQQSGYRSLHVVYQYQKEGSPHNGARVEVQYRTRLQHIWAIAVEVMSIFKNIDLKGGEGPEDLKRFFLLISSLFALQEGQNIAPGTSNDIATLVNEIKIIENASKYLEFLKAISNVVYCDTMENINGDPAYYVLKLDYRQSHITIFQFTQYEYTKAKLLYFILEQDNKDKTVDTVLVSVPEFADLEKTYQNYFLNLEDFFKIIDPYIK